MSKSIYTCPKEWQALLLIASSTNSFKIYSEEERYDIIMFELDGPDSSSSPCPYGSEAFRTIVQDLYGVDNVSTLDWVKEKKHQTFRLNYPEYQNSTDRMNDIFEEKYGNINPSSLDWVKEKKKATFMKNYPESKDIMEGMRNKFKEQYGVDNVSQLPERRKGISSMNKQLVNRPIVAEIKIIQKARKLTLGRGWTNRSTDKLEILLKELQQIENTRCQLLNGINYQILK